MKNTKMSYRHNVPTLLMMSVMISLLLNVYECSLDEERLISDIFNERKYNKYARPVTEEKDLIIVKFGVSLQSIVTVDEKNEMLHTNMWLNYEWFDYKLTWNSSEYGGVESIRMSQKMIWTPDILMYNSADEDIDSKFPVNIVVRSTGICSWVPLGLFISSCSINIKWFPFDDQECHMKFGSWTYDGTKLNLTLTDESSPIVDMSTYSESGEWIVLKAPATRSNITYDCCPEPYIDITFRLFLRRRTLYYGFNLIIPCALISSLALLTFLLPPDAGEKVSLGITVLLSLSVFSLIVADSVPSTSLAVPLVGIYFTAIMIVVAISVAITVLVLNFHHRNPDTHTMPDWIDRVVCHWLAWVLCMSRPGQDLSPKSLHAPDPENNVLGSRLLHKEKTIERRLVKIDNPSNYNLHSEMSSILAELQFITTRMKQDDADSQATGDWKFAAMVIDRLFFFVFTILFVITTVAIFFSVPTLFE